MQASLAHCKPGRISIVRTSALNGTLRRARYGHVSPRPPGPRHRRAVNSGLVALFKAFLMPFHHALAWLLMLIAPLAVGLVLFVLMRRNLHGVLRFALSLLAMALTFAFVLLLGIRCTDSIDARHAAARLLTPTELRSPHGAELMCPRVYLFGHNGHRECLVDDGDGGALAGCG